ncbi:hypothetical protein CLBP1_0.15 [Escherichia phage CLB_P1]|uniref:Uncharacterized protein n=1 Tax=Escherichia phage CLB_P1 TaxID=1262524 RepID=A0A7M4BMB5_9CAUD|nr:hypothetical protein CLBP1_0.15 [Escherichia phage CLB_P1]
MYHINEKQSGKVQYIRWCNGATPINEGSIMINQIKTTKSNVNGNVSHFIGDNERGTPYAAVTVQPNGDYWFTVYGSYSFGRPAHDKILQAVKPTGKNITAEKFYKK